MSHHHSHNSWAHAHEFHAGSDEQIYGFVKCKVIGKIRLTSTQLPTKVEHHLHADLKVGSDSRFWDAAINVGTSSAVDLLKYRLVSDFRHSVIETLKTAPAGFHNLTGITHLPALDYLRSDLLADTGSWCTSDRMGDSLNSRPAIDLKLLFEMAQDKQADLYIFGRTYRKGGPGIHDVHMNQGSRYPYLNVDRDGNETWQDGAVFFDFGEADWVAFFTAFTQQVAPTDHVGDPLPNSHFITDADMGRQVRR